MTALQRDQKDEFASREFPMTDKDFQRIKKSAYKITGITLTDHKKNMIYSRLARRLRRLDMTYFSEYCELIERKNSPEITDFTNAITTNLTSFFRENHHFEFLKQQLIPGLLKANGIKRRIRIWSAGCSTGEEPYSIAMTLSSFRELKNWDVKVLATDLDSNVVKTAKMGLYAGERADGIPDEYRRYLQFDEKNDKVQVVSDIQKLITFKQLNLLHKWPMKGPFDVIFCRNVVIYFDNDTQRVLFDRYADMLIDEGHLFIGHSENLHNVCTRFTSLGRTIYQRNA